MRSIHSKAFLDVWRALYHDSNPGPTIDRWRVDGVDWVRESYRVAVRDYAFHIETHVLTRAEKGSAPWTLMVVVERWWRPSRRDAFKTTEWRQVLEGRDKMVLSWFERQRARLDARPAETAAPDAG